MTDEPEGAISPEPSDAADTEDEDSFTVLEVFGLKLEVNNPRLAELLTTDVQTDVKDLGTPDAVKEATVAAGQGAPDIVLTPATPHDEKDAQLRREMRERAAQLGERMAFTTHLDGVWESPTGVVILTRTVEKPVSYAGASHFVDEIAQHRTELAGEDATVLFITPDQQTADVFKVAIRQAKLHHQMRTVSIENLTDLAEMLEAGAIDHGKTVILLAPIADIDVGEVISVIRSATEPDIETE